MTASSFVPLAKSRLRAEALARRDGLLLDERMEWDEEIAERALVLPLWKSLPAQGPVAAYWPMRSEADPRPILAGLAQRGFAFCLPAVVEGALVFRAWPLWGPLVAGGFGTLVPSEGAEIVTPAALIVPMAAFDRRGYRIGYGKGFYDKALKAMPGVPTVGVAYAAQEIPEVPHEPHDVALDVIVTERELISARTA